MDCNCEGYIGRVYRVISEAYPSTARSRITSSCSMSWISHIKWSKYYYYEESIKQLLNLLEINYAKHLPMFSSYHVIWYDPVQTKLNQVSAKLLPIKVHLCGSKWVLPISDRRFSISILAIDNKNLCCSLLIRSVRSSTGISVQIFTHANSTRLFQDRWLDDTLFETWLLSTFELWQKSSNR